jgi:hypothetical protein
MKTMVKDQIRCWCIRGTVVVIITTKRHVAGEVIDVKEEVVVGEDVLLVGVCEEEPSLVTQVCSPKTYCLSCTRSQEMGFWRPTIPGCGARRRMGWERLQR